MLAIPSRGTRVPDPDVFAFEPKWDGFRAVAYIEDDAVRIASRRGRWLTDAFQELVSCPATHGRSAVLDGELVCFGPDGKPDWNRLRHRAVCRESAAQRGAMRAPACFVAFDLLE